MSETQITPDMAACEMNEDEQISDFSDTGETGVTQLTAGAWSGWNEEQKQVISDHFQYTLHRLELINKCWAQGPTHRKDMEQLPKSDLHSVIFHGKSKGKAKKTTIASMTSTEFHNYLQELLIPKTLNGSSISDENFEDEETMVKFLTHRFMLLGVKANSLLSDHVDFGRAIRNAKTLFNCKRKEWSITDKWEKWISLKTGMSNSYVRQHVQVYELISRYPRLRQLNITYTELFKMSKKIDVVFTDDMIGGFWQTK